MLLSSVNHLFLWAIERPWRTVNVITRPGTSQKNGDFAQDDILDDADQRRQQQTMHRIFGPDVAVLSGDFLFAHVTWR